LNQQIGALTEKLKPVSEDHVSKAIRSLLAAGLALPSGMDVSKAPEIYAYALSGVPVFGVQKATAGIIRGEYDINRGFVPTPPEFAAISRLEAKAVREDLVRLREKHATLEESTKPKEKTNPAQLQRIREIYASFKAAHAASKVDRIIPTEPMSHERADYWHAISELRDAPEVSAEQQAFRRKIAGEIETTRPEHKEAAQ
jgi:hypothetical protein